MAFSIKDILAIEVVPALGCTEPAAVAVGAAIAATALPKRVVESIELWIDPNTYKNGIAAVIPGTGGLCGLNMATALGALGGNPELQLEIFDSIDKEIINRAKSLLASQEVRVNLLEDHQGLYIRTVVKSGTDTADSVIERMHNNVTSVKLNGSIMAEATYREGDRAQGKNTLAYLESWLKDLSLDDLLNLIDDLDDEDLAFLQVGVRANVRLMEYGLKHGPGLGIGKALERLVRQRLVCRDMILAAKMATSAAVDARMGGVKLPAMSSAGSGNHGLTAVLPIWAIREFIESNEENFLKAVCLSHIVTAYVKSFTGRLSAICGCSIAAGAGATAGTTYLLGGGTSHIASAIMNLMEDLAGVICDGAKAGCSLKVATAAGSAVQAALFALLGITVQSTDGIIGTSMEQTTKNIGTLSTCGMIETDRTILQIMIRKKFNDLNASGERL
ncbi:MAG: serine dehydratase subunit alpha family protein [Deltaproteobacteria bacterium]|nr:serine dehydratase subunit alpha family protein [Deltaproteobacteria bacterium]